jgi:hypothetical protein
MMSASKSCVCDMVNDLVGLGQRRVFKGVRKRYITGCPVIKSSHVRFLLSLLGLAGRLELFYRKVSGKGKSPMSPKANKRYLPALLRRQEKLGTTGDFLDFGDIFSPPDDQPSNVEFSIRKTWPASHPRLV